LYAILSHTWGESEITFQDIKGDDVEKRVGYEKVRKTCDMPQPTDSIMFGSILAALIRQAAPGSLKRSIPCTVGTKIPEYAMHILPMCRRTLLITELEPYAQNSQKADGLLEDGPFRSLSLLQL
jgi:hypothetical protein